MFVGIKEKIARNNTQKPFSQSKFFFANTIYGFCNCSFIMLLLTPFLRTKIDDPLKLSTIMSVNAITSFAFMYISGFMVDRIGARITFVIGKITDLIAICCLFSSNWNVLMLAVLIKGISEGITYDGKYNAYIYNYLAMYDKLKYYAKFSAGYYFMFDIACFLYSFISAIILKTNTYQVLIVMSIVVKTLGVISALILIPSKSVFKQNDFLSKSVKESWQIFKDCVRKNNVFVYIIFFYAFIQTCSYSFSYFVGDLMLLDIGLHQAEVAQYTSSIFMFATIGALIPIFFFKNDLKIRKIIICCFIQLFVVLIAILVYKPLFLRIAMLLSILTLPLFEISIERKIEFYSNRKIRGVVISISMSMMILMTALENLIVGSIAKLASYQMSGCCMMLLYLIMLSFLFKKLKTID